MGQKFAAYATDPGPIIAYYDSVDSPVPNGVKAFAITDTQWSVCLASAVPFTVANGALVAPAAPTAAELLAAAQSSQTDVLSSACAAAILGGFTSSALGSTYTYPSKATDQANLSASVIAALLAASQAITYAPGMQATAGMIVSAGGQLYTCVVAGPTGTAAVQWPTVAGQLASDGGAQWELWTTPFWCADSAGNWAFVGHASLQILKVGQDGKQAILANMAKNASLQAQVMAASTPAAVREINWTSGT